MVSCRREDMSKWRMIVIGLLGLTAASKFWGLLNPVPLLAQEDEILRMPTFGVVAGACFLESLLCILAWYVRDDTRVAWGVFAFAAAILSYRAVAYAYGISPCPCLGNVADSWPWLGHHESRILTVIACWLFLSSAMKLVAAEEQA